MRKQKSTVTLLALALVLAFGAVPVMAAEDTVPPTIPTVYPIEVHSSESGGVYRLEKVYCLGTKDDPAAIPTQSFEREGRHYELLDLLKADQTETDTQEHIEIITLESSTKDMSEIIKVIEPVMEVTTEDGYTGTLTADYTTIQVEASGYKNRSRTVTAERTYPNLSDADVSLIPKTVEENGRTLTLANVSWQEAATDPMDGYEVPLRYTAAASYTGTASYKTATGYAVTVEYKGDVTKTSCDTVLYDWGDVDLKIPGLNIQVQEISYDDELEIEEVYGSGSKPRGYGTGNYKASGKLSMLRDDYDDLLAYCKQKGVPFYKMELPSIIVSYANEGARTKIDELKKVKFSKRSNKAAQGDKSLTVDVDMMIVGGVYQDGVAPV